MTTKHPAENYFEDFSVGQILHCPTRRVLTDADRVAYISATGDRTPLYCDSKGLLHPLIVFHTVLGQTVRQISLNAVANLGYAELVWQRPVVVGEEIGTDAEVTGLKENSSGKSGIVFVRTTGRNQDGAEVLTYHRWVMVRKKNRKTTPYLDAPVVPTLEKCVSPDDLTGTPAGTTSPGGDWFLDDYEVGERILHVDGATINSTDHMNFTRLYQNSARVHFDAMKTGGNPLVYGGLVISLGYAQSFNGLENRLGIKAINGGVHANPVHSGDTLYTYTEVLGKQKISAEHGALRLRMLVLKNESPEQNFEPLAAGSTTSKPRYNESVVLDLDYWELIAKKGAGDASTQR